jgi:FAD synthetase
MLGNETNDKYKIVEEIKPDLICLGYDQTAFVNDLEKELKKRGLTTNILRIDAYKPNLYKSSRYKQQN